MYKDLVWWITWLVRQKARTSPCCANKALHMTAEDN